MENQDITINELAVMVKKGFDSVDESLLDIRQELGDVRKTNRLILTKLEDVVYRSELDQLKERVKIIEEAISLSKG